MIYRMYKDRYVAIFLHNDSNLSTIID